MAGMNNSTGQSLDNLDHLAQSISDILTTPLNSRVMRRDYGSACADLIDQPLHQTTLLQLYAACAIALAQWEPRIRLMTIAREIDPTQPGRAKISLDIVRLDTGTPEAATLSLSL